MIRILLDANLSPLTRKFLEVEYHFDVVDLLSLRLGQLPDEEVVKLAKEKKRIIITLDAEAI